MILLLQRISPLVWLKMRHHHLILTLILETQILLVICLIVLFKILLTDQLVGTIRLQLILQIIIGMEQILLHTKQLVAME